MKIYDIAAFAIWLPLIVMNPLAAVPALAHDADVCYAVADSGDTLVKMGKDGTNFAVVGNTGTIDIEAIAMRPDIPHVLYAVNADELGTINLTTGTFTSFGTSVGTGSGTDGNITFSDIDSLAFSSRTGSLWGAHRRSGEDVLIQIDPETGVFIPNAFSGSACGATSPCDYVVIKSDLAPINHDDIDDISIDPLTDIMYGIANSSGGGDRLIIINTIDGTTIDVGPLGVDDMEGFSNLNDGTLYGVTGSGGLSPNRLWNVNITTGLATEIGPFGSGSDYESVACLTEDGNIIEGTAFIDADENGSFNASTEDGLAGLTVRLYVDENNDDMVDTGDTLLRTRVTDTEGLYRFEMGIEFNFVVEVDTSTIPVGATMTTDNVEEADFVGFGNTDANNNFGFTNLPTLSVIKTSNVSNKIVEAGDIITYTVHIQNLSGITQTGVVVSDLVPTHTSYVAQSTAVTGPTDGNYRDEFQSIVYNGTNGTINWSSDLWTEEQDTDGGTPEVEKGSILVKDDGACPARPCLLIKAKDLDDRIYRRADLGSCSSATVTYDYNSELDGQDEIIFEVSGDNGANYTTIFTHVGQNSGSINESLNGALLDTNSRIRFRVSNDDKGKDFFIDNIQIDCASTAVRTSIVTKDNIPGGANADLSDGTPPALVEAADGFDLNVNEILTVTFQVQVDDPLGASVTEIVNTASVTTDQVTIPINAGATDYVPNLDSYEGDNAGVSSYSTLDELYLRDPSSTGKEETALYSGGAGYPPDTAFDVIYYDATGTLIFADTDASSDNTGFLQSAYTVADGLDTADQTFAYGLWTAVVIANEATQPATVNDVNTSNSFASDTFEVRSWSATQFTDAVGTPVNNYDVPGGETTAYLTINDLDQNTDPATIETITVTITDTVTGDSETVTLFETGPNTGVFANDGAGSRFGLTLADNCATVVTDDGTLCVDASVPSSLDVTFTDPADTGDSSSDAATTPVTLQFFQSGSGANPGEVWFRWQTATEMGNIGFHLQVAQGDQWLTITPQIIPSKAIHSADVLTYRYQATQAAGTQFRLLAMDQQGQQTLRGPFELGRTYGQAHTSQLIDWQAIRAERHAFRDQSRLSAQTSDAASQVTAVALQVQQPGVYRVTFDGLETAGFDLTHIVLSDLALINRGQAVPFVVSAPHPHTGADGYIEFYGTGIDDSLYTRTNVYVLQVDPDRARRVWSIVCSLPEAPLSTVGQSTVAVDRNLAYNFASPTHDPWYEADILAFTSPVTQHFSFDVEALALGAGAVTLEIELHGGTNLPQHPDHHVVAELNGTLVADVRFDGLQAKTIRVQVPAGTLRNGDNRLSLTLPGDTNALFDMVYLNRYHVTYPRTLRAPEGHLSFRGSGAAFHVRSLPDADVLVYRIDAEEVIRMQPQVTEDPQHTARYSAIFPGATEPAQYVVTVASATLTPEIVPLAPRPELTQDEAQLLIITHPLFRQALAPLVQARQAQGYTVKVVDVSDLYAQFGHHIVDAGAIRTYIAYAHHHLGTDFVLLVGGDTYDYLDYLDLGSVSFIPSLYAQTDAIVRFAPVDALYGDIDGDNVPDLAIGRWPVRSQAEAAVLVHKTLTYAHHARGKRQAMFVADAFDAAQNLSFTQHSEAMVARVASGWQVNRVYLEEQAVAQARHTIRDRINAGVALSSFVGHSGPQHWAFSGVWNRENAKALTNAQSPTVVAQWGCWNTYYISLTSNTLGHVFLLNPTGGAAAILGASTLTRATSNRGLALEFYGPLLAPGKTLGEAIVEAKQAYAQRHPAHLDVLLGWNLLGDPTLRVNP